MNETDQQPKAVMTLPPKPQPDYLLELLREIAAAFRVDLSEATLAVYLGKLSKYPWSHLEIAKDRTIEQWPEASKMPTIKFITDRLPQEVDRATLTGDYIPATTEAEKEQRRREAREIIDHLRNFPDRKTLAGGE